MLKCLIILALSFKIYVAQVTLENSNYIDLPVTWLAIGDFGGIDKPPYSTKEQNKVSDQMLKYSERQKASFVLALGDNFYPFGISPEQADIRFKKTFEEVYVRGSLESVPWFVIAGNHDHRTNQSVQRQIDYSLQSPVWKFPDYLYAFNFTIEQNAQRKLVTFVMIDTVLLCNLYDQNYKDKLNKVYYAKLLNQIKLVVQSDLIFLVGHHPIYTTMKGRAHSSCLHQYLLKLMRLFSIRAYIGGHDHTLQYHRYFKKDEEINLFISGAGQSLYKKEHVPHPDSMFDTEFYWSKWDAERSSSPARAGFLMFSLGFEHYNASFIDSYGVTLFVKTIEC